VLLISDEIEGKILEFQRVCLAAGLQARKNVASPDVPRVAHGIMRNIHAIRGPTLTPHFLTDSVYRIKRDLFSDNAKKLPNMMWASSTTRQTSTQNFPRRASPNSVVNGLCCVTLLSAVHNLSVTNFWQLT
jgi:hypothetical protein